MPVRFLAVALVLVLTGASAVAQVAPAGPTPTAAPDTLPIIGRTRSKRYCAVETDRTNGAISAGSGAASAGGFVYLAVDLRNVTVVWPPYVAKVQETGPRLR